MSADPVAALAAWRVVAAALDDARQAIDAGEIDAARAHLDVALDARRGMRDHGDTLPLALRRELYRLRRALASPDPRPWFGAPPTEDEQGDPHR